MRGGYQGRRVDVTRRRTKTREALGGLGGSQSRPALSQARLSLTPGGHIRYQLKTPYRDGTTHVLFKPLDFLARLAALVSKPRVNLTRYHGVFAPNSAHRARVTKAGRGKGASAQAPRQRRRQSAVRPSGARR